MKNYNKQSGFTLLELLITIVIIGILAAIAIPSYLDYTKKAHYSEIVRGTAPFKAGVSTCFQQLATLTGCSGGANGVPANLGAVGAITSISTTNGVITVTPVAQNGILATDTYILTPTIGAGNVMTWVASGGGVTNGYAVAG